MAADHLIAAVIPLQSQQLREQPCREQAGVPPDTVVTQRSDVLRMLPVKVHQAPHALPAQQGLIRHLKQRRIHLRQLPQPQRDGVTDAPVRMPVGYRHEAHAVGQLQHLRILAHHHRPVELLRRYGLQRPVEQRLALYLHRQLVLPEAPGISRRHHHASDPQLCHAASSFVPSFSYSIPGNAHSSQPPLSYN